MTNPGSRVDVLTARNFAAVLQGRVTCNAGAAAPVSDTAHAREIDIIARSNCRSAPLHFLYARAPPYRWLTGPLTSGPQSSRFKRLTLLTQSLRRDRKSMAMVSRGSPSTESCHQTAFSDVSPI